MHKNPNQLFLPLDILETSGAGSPLPPPEAPTSCRDVEGVAHALTSAGRPVCGRVVDLALGAHDHDIECRECLGRQ